MLNQTITFKSAGTQAKVSSYLNMHLLGGTADFTSCPSVKNFVFFVLEDFPQKTPREAQS
ncbi:hypothetical protein BH18ACI3_BH18ACI3_15160 [soil metagenome]